MMQVQTYNFDLVRECFEEIIIGQNNNLSQTKDLTNNNISKKQGDLTNMETNKTKQIELVNYENEAVKLDDAQHRPDFWNPEPGKYELTSLGEMAFYEYPNKKEPGIIEKRAKLTIELNGKQLVWSFGIGVTKASCYGQLVELAIKNGKTLFNKKFTVVVKSDGKKRDFTIV